MYTTLALPTREKKHSTHSLITHRLIDELILAVEQQRPIPVSRFLCPVVRSTQVSLSAYNAVSRQSFLQLRDGNDLKSFVFATSAVMESVGLSVALAASLRGCAVFGQPAVAVAVRISSKVPQKEYVETSVSVCFGTSFQAYTAIAFGLLFLYRVEIIAFITALGILLTIMFMLFLGMASVIAVSLAAGSTSFGRCR